MDALYDASGRTYQARDPDAEMVMNAGLKYLSRFPTLPAGARGIIEEITNFQAWHLAVRHEIDDEINELATRNAVLDT